ncbi:sensor histidine kinase [Halalkalibacter sp. APA_J-10(15)]|uniref:sensor histidine kinase n=1 Tax=Halalkalibacter sp. APA_J-10(15) TaxID=2933805 RepID=UPI001FF1DA14|nr:sensor histidine kinase [Halalkalibacter sp. APA_J-10(15)]MCK0473419.1 sensor histidine kinase [Halalkalibacter sp. APA_J-10(15)]
MSIRWFRTLRNQILVVFVMAMAIVMSFVAVMTYNMVASMLTNNAEKQIQQTVTQASGRVDALYHQLDMLTNQVATNAYVQDLLLEEVHGQTTLFHQRQSLMQVVDSFQAYSNGIDAFELYLSNERRLFPLNEASLSERIDDRWIRKAEEEKGRLIWIGKDRDKPGYFLALRQVNLMNRWFSKGGYLLVRIKPTYFEVHDSMMESEWMIVVDEQYEPVASNYPGHEQKLLSQDESTFTVHQQDYIKVHHESVETGWRTYMFTPVQMITREVSALRLALILSAGLGFFVFMLFSYLLATYVTKPLIRLTNTMRQGKDGELKTIPVRSTTVEMNELNQSYNQMVETINHLIEAVYAKEIVRHQSELKALQAQIHPHFLFNTLEALYWALEEKDEEELAEYVITLSELFRYTISDQKKDDWVSLREELDHVERYLYVMQVRFGDRISWHIDDHNEFNHCMIPKLTIQPLVENAILHGIGNRSEGGVVQVRIEPSDIGNRLSIFIIDNGIGMDQKTINGVFQQAYSSQKGMGMTNVNKRLQLYYKDIHHRGLAVKSERGEGTCVYFDIPMGEGVHDE